jgi:hypothetical protein
MDAVADCFAADAEFLEDEMSFADPMGVVPYERLEYSDLIGNLLGLDDMPDMQGLEYNTRQLVPGSCSPCSLGSRKKITPKTRVEEYALREPGDVVSKPQGLQSVDFSYRLSSRDFRANSGVERKFVMLLGMAEFFLDREFLSVKQCNWLASNWVGGSEKFKIDCVGQPKEIVERLHRVVTSLRFV